ncbi:MAG: hypothetical protein R3220_11770, partial [Balneolaceae bacterium]|nr:hypothetical protein [Balneolaceae bacterium]
MIHFKSHVPKVYLVLMMFFIPFGLSAQPNSTDTDVMNLSLTEAMNMALDQNFSLEQAGYDVDKTRAQYRQTNAVFLPQL